MRKWSHLEIVRRQKHKLHEKKLAFSVILNDIRSLYNVGSIFRTSDGAGVEKIWLCGMTGTPPNAQIAKTALGAQEHVVWEYRRDILSVIRELKEKQYQIVLLEQMQGSTWYQDFHLKPPVCLVVGNEINGVSDELIAHCEGAVEIEMAGMKNSLNAAVAFGIVAYHFRQQFIPA